VTVQAELHHQPVPRRALAISVASLAVPVVAAIWHPEGVGNTLGTLTWLTALIPAFLLAYYRGFAGVAVALAGGMAVITATQVGIVVFEISEPAWPLLAAIVGVYLGISLGIGALAEGLHRGRRAAEGMALLDQMTGLPNRHYADLVLEQEFAAAARGRALAVVIFDLDRFKLVNDRFGHPAGDGVIREFARVLRETTRRANLSARFGGEEFITILRDSDADAAVLFAQRVLDRAREMKFPWGRQTVSAGVAVYERGMGSYELLVGAADGALYRAKEGGRDMVCIAAPVAAPVAAPAPALEPAQAATGRLPTVYVVDDDARVLSTVKRMLNNRGMVVWGTSSPDEAIRSFTEAAPDDRPALIITDIIMPTMTGTRMMEQIAKVDPAVRVIYMSGYVHGENFWTGMPGSVVAVMEKPIVPDKMRETVARALAGATTTH
jgi:diguanylate cyclase (GGDEF)-like protein